MFRRTLVALSLIVGVCIIITGSANNYAGLFACQWGLSRCDGLLSPSPRATFMVARGDGLSFFGLRHIVAAYCIYPNAEVTRIVAQSLVGRPVGAFGRLLGLAHLVGNGWLLRALEGAGVCLLLC